jgi:hypothetical protein
MDMERVIEKLKEEAAKHLAYDDEDFELNDYAGGNINDACSFGEEMGRTLFARELLALLESSE